MLTAGQYDQFRLQQQQDEENRRRERTYRQQLDQQFAQREQERQQEEQNLRSQMDQARNAALAQNREEEQQRQHNLYNQYQNEYNNPYGPSYGQPSLRENFNQQTAANQAAAKQRLQDIFSQSQTAQATTSPDENEQALQARMDYAPTPRDRAMLERSLMGYQRDKRMQAGREQLETMRESLAQRLAQQRLAQQRLAQQRQAQMQVRQPRETPQEEAARKAMVAGATEQARQQADVALQQRLRKQQMETAYATPFGQWFKWQTEYPKRVREEQEKLRNIKSEEAARAKVTPPDEFKNRYGTGTAGLIAYAGELQNTLETLSDPNNRDRAEAIAREHNFASADEMRQRVLSELVNTRAAAGARTRYEKQTREQRMQEALDRKEAIRRLEVQLQRSGVLTPMQEEQLTRMKMEDSLFAQAAAEQQQ